MLHVVIKQLLGSQNPFNLSRQEVLFYKSFIDYAINQVIRIASGLELNIRSSSNSHLAAKLGFVKWSISHDLQI